MLLLLSACDSPPEPQPAEEQRLIVIDGITVTFEDVAPIVAWLDAFRPDGGRKAKVLNALMNHALPLALARRAFPEQRAQALQNAQALADVSTNIIELEKHSQLNKQKKRSKMARMQPKLAVAMFLFDPLQTGAVSEPIEVPEGYFVVSAYELTESQLAVGTFVDALQVAFVTHDAFEWQDWWLAEQQRIGEKATFVHPDYRDDLPRWIKIPEKP